MKNKLASLLAFGKNRVQSLRNKPAETVVPVSLLVVAVCMFAIGRWTSPEPLIMRAMLSELKLEIMAQKDIVDQLSDDQEINIDALAARLAEMKAASTRLDALGERLVQLGQLDPKEFDFNQPPPVGGPQKVISDGHSSIVDIGNDIEHLERTLNSQYARLDALQLLLLDRNLENERTPAGWPVSSGWISSGFGERNDPFTGKRAKHEGLDFAGVKDSEVLAVASGVIIWSGSRHGFGKLLEIDHGNGYVTRYAHNNQLLVKAGDRVSAGEVIARMGSTGRASSPHVHFEVAYKGKTVNPYKFVKQER